jgi:hypothetical protein
MRSFDCFDEQMNATLFLSYRGILGVGQWARRAVAQARDGPRIATKMSLVTQGLANRRFVGAKLMVHHLPYHLIMLHSGGNRSTTITKGRTTERAATCK